MRLYFIFFILFLFNSIICESQEEKLIKTIENIRLLNKKDEIALSLDKRNVFKSLRDKLKEKVVDKLKVKLQLAKEKIKDKYQKIKEKIKEKKKQRNEKKKAKMVNKDN